jgi:hypothetical protein
MVTAKNGPRQEAMLARTGAAGVIIWDGTMREMSAARRMVRRGALRIVRLGNRRLGYTWCFYIPRPERGPQ